ncbi:MAG TPA: hypothetical protein ENJ79_00755, partial [Gammaproteobacteria bacterium]|nr:hypothetical protein [Gammaproteobacteria bacterium]
MKNMERDEPAPHPAHRPVQGETAAELRLFQVLKSAVPEAHPEELAALLGLGFHPAPRRREISSADLGITPPDSPRENTVSATGYPPKEKREPFLRLSRVTNKQTPPESDALPDWYAKTQSFPNGFESRKGEFIDPEPLITWEQFWPTLHRLFGDKKPTRRLDHRRIIRRAVQRRPLTEIPWQQKPRWPEELVLVLDFSPHLSPFFADFHRLAQALMRWFRQRLRLIICRDASQRHFRERGRRLSAFPPIPQNAEILYLGDLGLLDRRGIAQGVWLEIGSRLQKRQARIEALVPVAPEDWTPELARYYRLRGIDRHRVLAVAAVDASTARQTSEEDTEKLLTWLSPAIELTLALVRRARLELGFSVSVESLVAQHPALKGNARVFQWRSPAYHRYYREQFRQQRLSRKRAWALIQPFETTMPIELQIEQRQWIGRPFTPSQRGFVRRLIRSAHAEVLQQQERAVLFEWIERIAERAGEEHWQADMQLLFQLHWLCQPPERRGRLPPGVDLSTTPDWIGGKPTEPKNLVLRQQGRHLLVTGGDLTQRPEGGELLRCQTHGHGQIQLRASEGVVSQDLAEGQRIELPRGLQSIRVQTPGADFELSVQTCPPWASGIGRDRHGLFVEVQVNGVGFVLRWIPPGEFQMGSPEDEPGRYDDEGPRHRVRFAQGFWLAETACTQAL